MCSLPDRGDTALPPTPSGFPFPWAATTSLPPRQVGVSPASSAAALGCAHCSQNPCARGSSWSLYSSSGEPRGAVGSAGQGLDTRCHLPLNTLLPGLNPSVAFASPSPLEQNLPFLTGLPALPWAPGLAARARLSGCPPPSLSCPHRESWAQGFSPRGKAPALHVTAPVRSPVPYRLHGAHPAVTPTHPENRQV